MSGETNAAILEALRIRAISLARVDAGLRQDILATLRNVESELVGRLAASGLSGDITPFKRERLEAMLAQITRTINAAYTDLRDSLQDELIELADIEAEWAVRMINRSAGVQVADTMLTRAQLEAIASDALIEGAPSKEWWDLQPENTMRHFAMEIRKGMLQGETNSELVKRVRENVMPASRRSAEALVRSSVQAVANDARMRQLEANEDIIDSYQHVSTLDDRTTITCAVRDGLRWTVDHIPIGHNQVWQVPPLHWSCRSIMVPILKSWREIGLDADDLPPGTRASMDGQVPEVQTYAQWLRKKGPEFQDEVLGPARAAMWRGGRISFRDLVDQTGRPLTLDELRELD